MAHTEEDFSEASIDARFDVCLTTCTFAVNIRSAKLTGNQYSYNRSIIL